MKQRCSSCGGPYFAKGLCERDLKRQRLGLPLRGADVSMDGPTVIVNSPLTRTVAMVKGQDGRVTEAIPSEGWYTHSQLEKEAIKAAESSGADLTGNNIIVRSMR